MKGDASPQGLSVFLYGEEAIRPDFPIASQFSFWLLA
jgi:hypothetical protein